MKAVFIVTMAVFSTIPLLAQSPPVGANNKAIQEIIDFRNHYIEAEENKDVSYLDKILVEDFFVLNPQGELLDKSHQLANIKRTDRILRVLNPRDTQVHFYDNGNVAILSERVTVDGEEKGHHFGGEFRFVRVFIRQHGSWQVVLAQGSPPPSPMSDAK